MLRPRRRPAEPQISELSTDIAPVPAAGHDLAASRPEPASRMACLGPPPLLTGEDEAGYDDLLARVSAAVQPRDILEEIWLRDFLDLAWESLRYRRLKAALLDGAAARGLSAVLDPLLRVRRATDAEAGIEPDPYLSSSHVLAELWAAGDTKAIALLDELLAAAGQSLARGMERARAQALSYRISHVERIERMLAGAEARRNAVLREIERHRATFGRALERAAEGLDVIETHALAPVEPA